jgi:hypothetical protein
VKSVVCSIALVFTLSLLGSAGCGGKDEAPEHKSIKGKVTRVDTSSGQVSMMWYNPKKRAEEEIPGKLAANAEILINGKTARLDDVMVDDEVTVTGFREKRDGIPGFVAVKVDIRRSTGSEPAESAATTSQPQQ